VQTIIEKTGLEPVTANTITDPDELSKVLLRVRSQGYAIDMEEQEEGVCCLAAPVFTPDGQILAATSISGPANRVTCGRLAELVPHVKGVADALSTTINSVDATST
jgi:DNA-binding IclR family transcriptional regulator